MKKTRDEILKWSNLFFFIPLAIAVHYDLYGYAVALLAAIIVSVDFHFFHQAKSVYYLDIIFSSTLMLSNLVLLYQSEWALPWSFFAFATALFAIIFYFRRPKHDYYFNHSLWHVFSAATCVFCLIAFLA